MTTDGARGPSWVGIGAQRSGTTWFTRMFTSHPQVNLGSNGRKEQHWFNRFAIDAFTADDAAAYRALFSAPNAGECTPAYLRLPWVAELLARACLAPPLVIVLLRDPIERFASAVRWQRSRAQPWDGRAPLERSTAALRWVEQATVGSMYGPQLAGYRDVFGPRRMLVLQYERLRKDPRAVLTATWQRLGLDPIEPPEVTRPSRTATDARSWRPDAAMVRSVVNQARPAVDQALREWDLDPALWPTWRRAAHPDTCDDGRGASDTNRDLLQPKDTT